ncbi:MAG: hypothetical protein HQK95_07840 [Nitrospirae bacterium]|nr:hypothetical protein [Nitrospirota bacterium]
MSEVFKAIAAGFKGKTYLFNKTHLEQVMVETASTIAPLAETAAAC